MLKILKNFRPIYWAMSAAIVVLVVVQTISDLILVQFIQPIVDTIGQAATGAVTAAEAKAVLWKDCGIMLGFAALSVASLIAVSYLSAKVSAGFARDVRKKVFDKVSSFSMEEINRFSTASLITRSTNDITQVQQVVMMMLRMALTAPIMAIGALIMIIGKNWQLSTATGVGIVAIVVSVAAIFGLVIPKFKKIQEYTDALNGVTREHLTGLRVVRAYNAEQYQIDKFERVNEPLTGTHIFVTRMLGISMPGMQLIMNGLGLAIIWISAALINKGSLDIGEMLSFQVLANIVLMSFMMLSVIFIMLPRGAVSARRINEVLDTVPKVVDPEAGKSGDPSRKGEVVFDGVAFAYPDAEDAVIKGISFTAESGKVTAIIGSTGSGKSTLVNLIPRFYDATEGTVYVDGVDVREYKQQELHEKIGYVPQKGTLFSGTIESNIKFADVNISDEDMIKAAEIAQADGFISEKEEGYASPIAQGGKNVSGGQKQRLSIARAIVKRPEIYIFDDSFSALDYKTDKTLRAALARETAGATSIIVAQRIGTIINADKIIVLDKGRIVGEGAHRELLADCEVYREIAYSQLSKEELENAGADA